MLALLAAVWALAGPSATAQSPAPMSPSVMGEPAQGGGVFRFPQAVAVSGGGTTVFVGDQYSGVVQAFGRDGTPRFSIGARASRREPGRLGVVGGVATDRSGHLYVLDSENERVQVFDAGDGHHIAQFGNATVFDLVGGDPATGAGISASGLAVAQASPAAAPVVYVADQGRDRVARFVLDPATLTPSGAPRFSPPSVDLSAPQGVALDSGETRLYVADDDHHRVVVLNPQTLEQIASVGSFGTAPGQFQNPYDVAVDAGAPAQLYVADNLNSRVDVFDASTLGFRAAFGRPGYGPGLGNLAVVRSVGAVADAPGGGVVAADTANNRVQAFDAAGNVTAGWGLAGRGPGYVTRPRGVAFAPDGGIAVADTFDSRVELFAPDGTYAGQRGLVSSGTGFAAAGSAAGQFNLPSGVAYDAAGTLWVTDTANDRIVALEPGGAVVATTPAGALSRPLALAASSAGVYVADSGGGAVRLVGAGGGVSTIRAGLNAPAAIAIGPSGTPYVADAASVRDAATDAAIAGPGGGTAWDHPAGLAFDAAGRIYVSERRPGTPTGARVVRGTPAGAGFTWDVLATEGSGAGQVIEPGGLAATPDGGTLLVADTGNNRVLRLDAPGHTPPAVATLTTGAEPAGTGAVTSDPAGIACPTDCRQGFGRGRAVAVAASPAPGWVFAGWSGACAPAGAAASCSVTMGADRAAVAHFTPAPPPAPPAPAAAAPPPPVRIRSVRLSTHSLRLARRADRRRHRAARRATRAAVTVRLTVPATLTATVQQGRPGRRSGSRCRPPSRALRRARRCTRFVTLRRRRTVRSRGTTARFTLRPTFGSAGALRPGSYRLAVAALDARGNRVGPVTRDFRVAR